MATVSIDQQKCVKCGKCAEVCPTGVIESDEQGCYTAVHEDHCVSCGHCAAFCPADAVTVECGYPAVTDSQLVKIDPQTLGTYMRQRRSVRNFTDQTVDDATVKKLYDVARYAPTAINRQEVKWVNLSSPSDVHKVASMVADWVRTVPDTPEAGHMKNALRVWDSGKDSICRGAPHLAIAYSEDITPLDITDTVIAMTYFELLLPSFGLGGCWAGFVHRAATFYKPLQDFLGIDPMSNAFAGMLYGYPRDRTTSIPAREAAKVQWR